MMVYGCWDIDMIYFILMYGYKFYNRIKNIYFLLRFMKNIYWVVILEMFLWK